jgi:hypothetical protein
MEEQQARLRQAANDEDKAKGWRGGVGLSLHGNMESASEISYYRMGGHVLLNKEVWQKAPYLQVA